MGEGRRFLDAGRVAYVRRPAELELTFSQAEGATEDGRFVADALAEWMQAVRERRDLTLPPPLEGGDRGPERGSERADSRGGIADDPAE